jgi:ABC-type branched-subunit amino acid transport system substrate-binding protein
VTQPLDFSGRAGGALVVGGSSGLGSAVALMLAERGSDVAVTFRGNEVAAEEVRAALEKCGVRAAAWQVDLLDADRCALVVEPDISGPVPGLFESAQQGTRAYAAYFNATSDICGRKLEVVTMDSRTDSGGDQQGYTRACESAFAAIGSMSAFDAGGAATADACGIPDIRSTSVTPERTR